VRIVVLVEAHQSVVRSLVHPQGAVGLQPEGLHVPARRVDRDAVTNHVPVHPGQEQVSWRLPGQPLNGRTACQGWPVGWVMLGSVLSVQQRGIVRRRSPMGKHLLLVGDQLMAPRATGASRTSSVGSDRRVGGRSASRDVRGGEGSPATSQAPTDGGDAPIGGTFASVIDVDEPACWVSKPMGAFDASRGEGVLMALKKTLRISIVVFALLAVSCGGDDDDGGSTEIDVSMEEFMFTPTEWTVAADQEITVNLENNGSVEHEFVVLQSGVTVESEADLPETEEELLADFVYWEDEVVTAPPAGTYQVICAIEDHFDAGMTGTLTVEA
jgi:uncharacterized cupredoxin-like copper-binding protein